MYWHSCSQQSEGGGWEGREQNTQFHISGNYSAEHFLCSPCYCLCTAQDGCGSSWRFGDLESYVIKH